MAGTRAKARAGTPKRRAQRAEAASEAVAAPVAASAEGAPTGESVRVDGRVKATRREQIAANQAAIANLRARLAGQPDARAIAESERWDRFLAALDADHTFDRRLFR